MRFDDRLLTVLNQPAEDRHDAAVRWRQLVDLVARAGANSASPVAADALDAIRDEASAGRGIASRSRRARRRGAAACRSACSNISPRTACSVAAPVLAAATLDARQWRALLAVADEETQAFIADAPSGLRARSSPRNEPERACPPTWCPRWPARIPSRAVRLAVASRSVERIERRRRLRSGQGPARRRAHRRRSGSPALFRWECGPGGEIAWVEGAPRGPLIGRSIARQR